MHRLCLKMTIVILLLNDYSPGACESMNSWGPNTFPLAVNDSYGIIQKSLHNCQKLPPFQE